LGKRSSKQINKKYINQQFFFIKLSQPTRRGVLLLNKQEEEKFSREKVGRILRLSAA